MKRTVPMLAATLLCLLAAAPATQPASRLLARAHLVLATLKTTHYQHVTDIDEPAGEYNCDCSGLVSWLLKKELPAHYAAIPFPQKYRHPRAIESCRHFESAPTEAKPGQLWQRIARAADAAPGDVLAWHKEPLPEKGTTGHIVLLDSAPTKIADDIYAVTVIDSTTGAHKDDTRKPDQTGVGRGTIFVRVDADGQPTAYASRSADGPFKPYPMGIGRPLTK
jgi:hypothetical protein